MANWYTYNGTSFSVPSVDPTSTSNVYIVPSSSTSCINASNVPTLNSNDGIVNLTVATGSSLDLSTNTVSMSGNLNVNGNITGSGTILLNGTGNQTISGSGIVQIPNLQTNKSTGNVTLNNPVKVMNTLTMTNGNINTGSNILERSEEHTSEL